MYQLASMHEGEVFAWIYIISIALFASWEALVPRRQPGASLRVRWTHNALNYIVGVLCVRLVIPFSCVSIAYLGEQNNWSLIDSISGSPLWLQAILAVLFMDLARWIYHFLLHQVPWLWRFHRVHHTDTDFDISTALRFHPVEIFVQVLVNVFVILSLGLPAAAVLIFESIVLFEDFFNHGNIRLKSNFERILRMVIVTPDMHRIHHSSEFSEYNSNYAAIFSWWDRLFGTYIHEPRFGQEGMVLGLEGFQDEKHLKTFYMLANPFLEKDEVLRQKKEVNTSSIYD